MNPDNPYSTYPNCDARHMAEADLDRLNKIAEKFKELRDLAKGTEFFMNDGCRCDFVNGLDDLWDDTLHRVFKDAAAGCADE